jgi:hypothetical protein
VAVREPSEIWDEYYRRRNWARLDLIAAPLGLYLLLQTPKPILNWFNALPDPAMMTLLFAVIGLMTICFAIPLLRWVEWQCPRCGEKFAEPKFSVGILTIVLLVWPLVVDSACNHCELRCGQRQTN